MIPCSAMIHHMLVGRIRLAWREPDWTGDPEVNKYVEELGNRTVGNVSCRSSIAEIDRRIGLGAVPAKGQGQREAERAPRIAPRARLDQRRAVDRKALALRIEDVGQR